MPTTQPRINVVFDQAHYQRLKDISKIERDSLSHVVSKLVVCALELSEDLALAESGEQRLSTFKRETALTSEDLLKWNKSRRKTR